MCRQILSWATNSAVVQETDTQTYALQTEAGLLPSPPFSKCYCDFLAPSPLSVTRSWVIWNTLTGKSFKTASSYIKQLREHSYLSSLPASLKKHSLAGKWGVSDLWSWSPAAGKGCLLQPSETTSSFTFWLCICSAYAECLYTLLLGTVKT